MWRRLVIAGIAGLLLLAGAGCARRAPVRAHPSLSAAPTLSGLAPATDRAEIYIEVLRRYLATPEENSFPDRTFGTVYILDHAYPHAADPAGAGDPGPAIEADVQRAIAARMTQVVFIANRDSVLDPRERCAHVINGGTLVTLGSVDGDANQVHVGINGFVACLGATWLTYVVAHRAGTGWHITGTTGPMAIA